MAGSLLDNQAKPLTGQKVWGLVGYHQTPRLGTIVSVTNIDGRGLANTYVDLALPDGTLAHLPVNCLFDRKPKLTPVTDCYGTVNVWR